MYKIHETDDENYVESGPHGRCSVENVQQCLHLDDRPRDHTHPPHSILSHTYL